MARDDDHSNADNGFAHEYGAGLPGGNLRQEPTFGRFHEDDPYEVPERDANYTSGYHPDDADPEQDSDDDFAEDDDADLFQDDNDEQSDADMSDDDEDEDDSDTWLEEEGRQSWPASLIAVAVVALVLLAAGVYGVMQQRAATEEELRDLRAKLATTVTPAQGSPGLETQGELKLAYDKLAAEAEALRLENKTLTDTVAGLETQLGSQQQAKPTAAAAVTTAVVAAAAVAAPATSSEATVAQPTAQPTQPAATQPPEPAPEPVKTVPAPAPKPVATKPAVAAASGAWFVNFGSYATRNMADSWAARLKPSAGKVIIMPITSGGRTLYRLRIVGLADSTSAKQVARKLETELRVSELWVGKE